MRSTAKFPIDDETEVPPSIQDSWQAMLDLLAEIVGVPSALIMRVHASEIEVFGLSSNEDNVYEKGEKAPLDTGLYCESVLDTQGELMVPNAMADPEWDHNPDVELGMISYLGLPLRWPKGELFGTICVLDNKENVYSDLERRLLGQFQVAVELGLKDISERKSTEERLRHLANHDTLTGLPTRRLGMEHISSALARARREKSKAAVLFVDLDGFKLVNDALGHAAGDCLLESTAKRLSGCVREIDTVARVGGDEFMILLVSIDNNKNAALVAQKLIDAMARSFTLGDEKAAIGVSVGIAIYPDHGTEPTALLNLADKAMYAVRSEGKNSFAFANGG
ncbi:MAG: sensor domain-containing diguanylate cyclase [Alphaproteobacteria bacterium]|nr:sensor domain-containing diguanylate cyclase [Alphaproteobacteria bacterium]